MLDIFTSISGCSNILSKSVSASAKTYSNIVVQEARLINEMTTEMDDRGGNTNRDNKK